MAPAARPAAAPGAPPLTCSAAAAGRHYRLIEVVPYGIEIPPIGQGTYNIWRYEATTR